MSNMRALVEAKMKDEAPALYRRMSAAGSLKAYLDELADEATSAMVSLKMVIAKKHGLDKETDLIKRTGILNSAQQAAREIVMAELGFPLDETSQQSLDATTASATTI